MPTLHARIRAARVGLGLGQKDLATAADLPLSAVKRLESGKDVVISTLIGIQDALRRQGAEFVERDGRLGVLFSSASSSSAGSRYRALREALGLEQLEFATLAGLSVRTLRKVENDDPTVSEGARAAVGGLLDTLGVNLSPDGKAPGFLLPTSERFTTRLSRLRRSMVSGVAASDA